MNQPAAANQQDQLPDLSVIPRAVPAPGETPIDHAILESDVQSQHGDVYQLSGDVHITYRDHDLRADTITYDKSTGEVMLEGHVHVTGGENNESIEATHGVYNLHSQTGTFYDVIGSVGVAAQPGTPRTFTTTNPFLFNGKKVVESSPGHYEVFDGSVTSCLLPHPDWQLFGSHIQVDQKIARMYNSTFRLLGLPLLFLPYVTHPVNADVRQSGILIPVLSFSSGSGSSGSKGLKIGEQYFVVLGRSADATVGLVYYSERGWAENGTFRFKGQGEDFFNAHFSALQDRGFYSTYEIPASGKQPAFSETLYTNQGGQDVTAAFKHQFTPTIRAVGDAEYLSSYIYREAFTENFNQAVSSDILSTLYITQQTNGYSLDARADRYQGEKVVPVGANAGAQIKIFHAPSLDFTALDHPIAHTPLLWSMNASAAGLKRSQTNFQTSGITERLDFQPQLSLPLSGGGWHTMTSVALRDTFYSRSRQVPYNLNTGVNGPNAVPIEVNASLNRSSVDLTVDIRPPAIEKDFAIPEPLQKLFGVEGRHTIEPEITYRNVHGIDNFLAVLRFDDDDLAADTDQLRYGVVQHLYFRPRPKTVKAVATKPGCPAVEAKPSPEEQTDEDVMSDPLSPELSSSNDANGIPDIAGTAPDVPTRTHKHDPCAQPKVQQAQQEWFSWRVEQEHYFAQNFGGAVIDTRRNIFDSTLDFSGIAFLTEARSTSPLISRMRFRTSSHTDLEWDFDYDTGASKFNSQNVFMDAHEGQIFGGISYAYLNAPGRFHSEQINSVTNLATGVTTSAVSDFSQMRALIGYGAPTRPGLSAAGGAGIDVDNKSLQYMTLQGSYNWNCCGLSVEYRRYNLGNVREEGTYSFNFTLANIGSAGNMRRAQALF